MALCIWVPLLNQESNVKVEDVGGIIKIPAVPNSAEGGAEQAVIIADLLGNLDGILVLSDGLKTLQAGGCMNTVCPYLNEDYSSVELLKERERTLRELTGASYRHIACGLS